MNALSPQPNPDPFSDNGLLTMSDLISLIIRDENMPMSRRQKRASSVRCFCRAIGAQPSAIPASFSYCSRRLKGFHPADVGYSTKTWSTIKSDVSKALQTYVLRQYRSRAFVPLSGEWSKLKEGFSTKYDWGLGRLARFCSKLGIEPAAVTDDTLSQALSALGQETLKTNLRRLERSMRQRWNKVAALRPDLGLSTLTLKPAKPRITPDWTELHPQFRREAEAWFKKMSTEGDLLDETAPARPLRSESIKAYRYRLLVAVAALCANGQAIDSVANLATLLHGDHPKQILRHLLDRNDGKTSSVIQTTAHVLVLLGQYACDVDEGTRERLRTFRRQLKLSTTGLSDRPRSTIRQFADERNVEKILELPIAVYRQISRKAIVSRKDALQIQAAVALELELMRPIRLKNLAELRLGVTLIRNGKAFSIAVPAHQVKNSVNLDHPIPTDSAKLLNYYIDKVLPLFGPNPEGWLFPGDRGKRHKSPEQLSRNYKKLIREWTGLRFYVHFTRHFAALLCLQDNPGNFELVRRVLAHKSLATTTKSYIDLEDQNAVKKYNELILNIRERLAAEGGNTDA